RKTNKFGEVVRYKARLGAKGFRQIEGLDYQDTFAPTPSPASLKMVLGLAADKDWELKHWDAKQAFIQANISEKIFVRLCDGCGISSGMILRLVKALYGTKQASREFNNRLVHVLEQCGLEQCRADPYVLRYIRDGVVCAMIAPHVDDLLVAGKIDVSIWICSRIKEQFSIEDFGDLEYYMGCEISRDRTAQTVTIGQTRYIKSVCQRFGMDGAKKRSVPHDLSRTLDKSENHPSVDGNAPYREAVGSLMWASVMTRLDIANAIREVAKYSSNPNVTHWRAVRCILAYLN
ncbi:unnamed protein product, partial [Choristocarpus tenellus]